MSRIDAIACCAREVLDRFEDEVEEHGFDVQTQIEALEWIQDEIASRIAVLEGKV